MVRIKHANLFNWQVYYKEAVGAFIVFDVTRASTFEAVQKWKNDLDSKVMLPNGAPIPVVLLANKVGCSLQNRWIREASVIHGRLRLREAREQSRSAKPE